MAHRLQVSRVIRLKMSGGVDREVSGAEKL
jgi:hypothetical protein